MLGSLLERLPQGAVLYLHTRMQGELSPLWKSSFSFGKLQFVDPANFFEDLRVFPVLYQAPGRARRPHVTPALQPSCLL